MNSNNAYCRLEGFYPLIFENDEDAIREKSIFFKYDVYVKTFNDIKSLKQQIIKSTNFWVSNYPEKEIYLTYEEWKNNLIGSLLDENRDRYPGFLIFNRWKDWKTIGFCYKGWYTLENKFAKYLHRYIFELHGSENFHKYRDKLNGKEFLFLIPEVNGVHERSLLSNDLIDIELEHFLEGKEITEEIEQKVFYPEMVRRGYIDILNEK